MKPAKAWANEAGQAAMQVPKTRIQGELDIYFRKAQGDALRWAADVASPVDDSLAEVIRIEANRIERGDKQEGGMGKHKTRSRDQRIQAVLTLRGTECKCYFPKRKRRTKK
jgi:hypothetical protein